MGGKESLGVKMLEAYNGVRPLEKAEKEYLALRLCLSGKILEDRQFLLSFQQGVDP